MALGTNTLLIVALLSAPSIAAEPVYRHPFFCPLTQQEKIWGEPSLTFHKGTYYLIYDTYPHRLPFYLATSPDGVYWREEGEAMPVDEDAQHIECPSVHRFRPEGPYVMQYAFTAAGNPSYRIRFAVSDDLRTWKKLGPESTIHPDPRWYDVNDRWDTQYAVPSPDGKAYLALWDGKPKDCFGLALGKTSDGIHWEVCPPVEVRLPVPGPKRAECAGEIGGFHYVGGRYFLILSSFGSCKYEPMVLSSSKPEGPYSLAPKNPVLAPHPCFYLRTYRLSDNTIVAVETVLLHKNPKRFWCLPPLKQVALEGSDLWLKWWPGNNKAKAVPVAIGPGHLREGTPIQMLGHDFDLQKGVVLEGTCRLSDVGAAETDLAKKALVTASQTAVSGNMPGTFRPESVTEGKIGSFWVSAGKTNAANFYELDLGSTRRVGRVEIQWLYPASLSTTMLQRTPVPRLLLFSSDAKTWQAVDSAAGVHAPPSPSEGVAQFTHWSTWPDLKQEARYVRITMPPFGNGELGMGLCEASLYEAGQRALGKSPNATPGLLIECDNPEGQHYAILMERDGTVRFGFVDGRGGRFRTEIRRKLEVAFPDPVKFRLLMRQNLGEFYLGDYFVSSFKLGKPTGRIGIIPGKTEAAITDVKAWHSQPPLPVQFNSGS